MELDTILLNTAYHQKMMAVKQDFIAREVIRRGVYEKTEIDLVLCLLEKIDSPVVLDVGANIGNHALPFSTKAARVYG